MRLAVLADIHGNLRALEAVLADVGRRSPDMVVNLGDNVSGPLQAAATADLLMGHRDWIHVRGNHDRQLLDRPPERMGPSDRAAHAQLSPTHLDWLASLPPTHMAGDDVLLCHGSPIDDWQYLLEEVDAPRVRLASSERIQERLGDAKAGLVLCGHTHIPRIVSLPGGTHVINPGSVGLPAYDDTSPAPHYVETGSPHARYAIVDWDGKAARAEFIALEYDWRAASREAAAADRPEWAHALATGYALRHSKRRALYADLL
jgi:putative phosphoesterase